MWVVLWVVGRTVSAVRWWVVGLVGLVRAKGRESANLEADSVWFLSLLLCYGTSREDGLTSNPDELCKPLSDW